MQARFIVVTTFLAFCATLPAQDSFATKPDNSQRQNFFSSLGATHQRDASQTAGVAASSHHHLRRLDPGGPCGFHPSNSVESRRNLEP